ncbi:RNA polymerase sigma factor [Clostridium cavendishii DSM 21758]|uniref:RNA polymerase sigma factor SigI n=1 Tax=Clostridium cavendishii DSM 21758 TaxID=1121302 RepID=A0A1M6V6I6_9CLOT|nr:sigma factor [Clostridium cavendishii]SHK77087.1 RNA polymerase sigma factor [Clostridium cavendishii DSM 21758]
MEVKQLEPENRSKLIDENKGYIYSIACKVCGRRLDWNNDDELSIALIAFNNACDTYDNSKGNFLSYTNVLIKNALIDFFRKSKSTPHVMFKEDDETADYIDNKNSLIEFEKQKENLIKAEEIKALSKELLNYKLSFNDLVEASPVHIDTRNTLLNIAFKCSKQGPIIDYIKAKRKLPVKEIMLLTTTNRKLVEKWRKYILVLILILSNNEYTYIKSYLNIKVGENNE